MQLQLGEACSVLVLRSGRERCYRDGVAWIGGDLGEMFIAARGRSLQHS